ncbi:MAG: chromosome segregation protein SMC [Clostridiales bacterium]|nr:chromosome segregation protein SMC [Bacillota bacterium]PWL94790.1 MAG: chromosome segregation protein SMC [Clostridiales bacterium]
MYFKRLEMHGFKSFAEPAVIEFHEGVTCIVGPNGSGKSNISDAIRWVLGEQSPKMLRGGKMEEVIFSGTASRKSRGMAEVTLVIDNTEGMLPIDYNEVAITRRMYRSGESEYLINNNQCRLRDVRELIMDTGIGVDGYSIIGQGKISEIVSSKPESRREIFEEAAGVVMYKSKKAESERKLNSAKLNLERVDDIIGEIEGRIDGLREDSIKAKEYIKLRDRFRELEINITIRNIEKLEEAEETTVADIKSFADEIEKLTKEKSDFEDRLSEDKQKNDNLEQLSKEARDKLVANIEETSRLTNKSQLDAEKAKTLEKDINRVSEEISLLYEKKKRESENADSLVSQREETEAKAEKTESELNHSIQDAGEINTRLAKLVSDLDDNRNKMYEAYNKVASKKSEALSMEGMRDSLTERKEQINEERKLLEDNRRSFDENLEKAEREQKDCEKMLSEAAKELRDIEEKLSEVSERRNSADKELSHVSIKLSQSNTRKKTIEEMESNYEGYNSAVKFIMKSHSLKGIEGVAAELMKVPSGLEVAVETAMGASLQNIICLRDGDAKEAIRILKENKAGRLTFLPVESIKGSRANIPASVSGTKGYVGLACDLVDYDEKYKSVFTYLLGRVAIVETMQDAIDFSKKAPLRFVTKEGEIVNAGGAITGGKYKNKTANLLERKSEIIKLDEQINVLSRKKLALEKEIQETKNLTDELKNKKNDWERREKDLQLKAVDIKAGIKNINTVYRELEDNAKRQQQRLLSIERDLSDAEIMSENLKKEADYWQSESEKAKAEIARIMEIHETVRDEADKAAEKTTTVRIEKNKIDAELQHIKELTERINTVIDETEGQIAVKRDLLKGYEEEKNNLLFGSGDIEEKVKAKIDEKLMLEEYIAKVDEEKLELSEKIKNMSFQKTEIEDRINSYQSKKYSLEIRKAKNETQLESLKDKIWEDFEISYLQAIEFKKGDFVMSSAQKESRDIKSRLKELGEVNVGAIDEYAQISERYEFLLGQRGDITEAMKQLQTIVDDMEKTIKTRFKENFDNIVINFEEIFKQLFGGGHAELRLDNEENPLESGIEIVAQPPGKKLQNINLMSGGEKTMTAIALMFAVLKTRPTPFCILDEVEAALDDNNIERFSKYLHKFKDIQFTIVTHQKATMEHADVLYGVTMPEQGISKVLSLRLGDNLDL